LKACTGDTCTVIVREKVIKTNRSTGFQEKAYLENQPCKISFSKAISAQPVAANDGVASAITQDIKLFMAPEITIPPGSKIIVTHFGKDTAYQGSGVPAVFANHQEIRLELFKQWA
jgi:hypothetical protein